MGILCTADEHTYQNDVLTFIIISVGIILLIALISAGATMMVIVKRHSKRGKEQCYYIGYLLYANTYYASST